MAGQPVGTDYFMRQRLLMALSSIRAATGQLRSVRNIAELTRAQNISLPAELRHVVRSMPEMRRFTMAAEDRSLQIVKSQLSDLATLLEQDGGDACGKALARLQQ